MTEDFCKSLYGKLYFFQRGVILFGQSEMRLKHGHGLVWIESRVRESSTLSLPEPPATSMAVHLTAAVAIVAPRAASHTRAVRAASRTSTVHRGSAFHLAPLRRAGATPAQPPIARTAVRLRASGDGEGSLLDELDADQRCPVPRDQRPSSQLKELQESPLLGWGGLELPGYLARLGFLGAFFYVVLAYPIASVSYDPRTQGLEAIICATTGTCVATAAISLLIYNNWSYVRDRLLSATVEYEETGWYDGQVSLFSLSSLFLCLHGQRD